MTIEEIIYDIKLILRATTDDTRISDAHLLRKILNYRSIFITEAYTQTNTMNASWIQRLGNKALTPSGSADNPNITDGTVKLGKMTLPSVIPIGPEKGIYRISDTQRQKQVYPTTWPQLMHMISYQDNSLRLFRYYVNIGNEYYVYPVTGEVDVMIVLENPLEGYKFSTELVSLSDLESGTEYYVLSGSVRERTITLYPGGESSIVHTRNSTFTAGSASTYSGDGKVRRATQMTEEALNKEFPVDAMMAQRIVLEILTKDFAIERQGISDVINDAQDETKVMAIKR